VAMRSKVRSLAPRGKERTHEALDRSMVGRLCFAAAAAPHLLPAACWCRCHTYFSLPSLHLPSARSCVCHAVSYFAPCATSRCAIVARRGRRSIVALDRRVADRRHRARCLAHGHGRGDGARRARLPHGRGGRRLQWCLQGASPAAPSACVRGV